MTISAIRKVNQYLEITENGNVRRISVDWADCVVSAIMSGRYKVLNIFFNVSDGLFYATYENSTGTQSTVQLGGGGALADLSDVDLTGLSNNYILYYDSSDGFWKAKAESPGVTDHGALTGLADDDHTQYLKKPLAAGHIFVGGEDGLAADKELTGDASLNSLGEISVGWADMCQAADTCNEADTVDGHHASDIVSDSVAAAKLDADIADAISKKHSNSLDHSNALDHTQGTDQGLDYGGANAVVVADVKDAVDKKHSNSLDHTRQHAITSTSDHTSAATSGKILKADANGLPVDATNTDTDVADAVTKKHTAGAEKLDDHAAPDNNTDLNVSITAHGLCPILPNDATKYLDGSGAYSVPVGSGSVPYNFATLSSQSTDIPNNSYVVFGRIHIPAGKKLVVYNVGIYQHGIANLVVEVYNITDSASEYSTNADWASDAAGLVTVAASHEISFRLKNTSGSTYTECHGFVSFRIEDA